MRFSTSNFIAVSFLSTSLQIPWTLGVATIRAAGPVRETVPMNVSKRVQSIDERHHDDREDDETPIVYPDRAFTLAVRDSADVDGDVIRIEIEDRTNPDNSVVLVESLELSGSYCEPMRFTVAQPVDTVVRVSVLQDSADQSQAGASGVSLSMRVEDMLEGLMWDQTYEQFAEYAFITITLDPVLPGGTGAASRPEHGSVTDAAESVVAHGGEQQPVLASMPMAPRELLRVDTDAQAAAVGRIVGLDLSTVDPQLVATREDGWTLVPVTKSDGNVAMILTKQGPFGVTLLKTVDGAGVDAAWNLPTLGASTEHGTKSPNLTKPTPGLSGGGSIGFGRTETNMGVVLPTGRAFLGTLETSLGRVGLGFAWDPDAKVPLGGGAFGPESMLSVKYVGAPGTRPDGQVTQHLYKLGAGATSGFALQLDPKKGRLVFTPGVGFQLEFGAETR